MMMEPLQADRVHTMKATVPTANDMMTMIIKNHMELYISGVSFSLFMAESELA